MNDKFLEDAQTAAEAADRTYREADFATKLQMKPDRDKAFELVAALRRQIASGAIVLTQGDIDEMTTVRTEISEAADKQSQIIALAKLTVALGKRMT